MKLIIAILSVILVVGLCYASQLPEFPFVFARGQAEVEVPPDIATISFRVEEFQEDPDNALEVVRERSTELIDFFAEHKLEKKDIVSFEIDKNAIREKKDYKELNIIGYELIRRFKVTIKDLSQYEVFMKKLLSLKNVTGINSQFDRADRQKIEADLIVQGIEDAKQQAEFMARGFGVQLGPVHAISKRSFKDLDAEFGFSFYDDDLVYVRRWAPPPEKELLFVPSTITLKSAVNAIFKLEQKE